MTAQRGHYSRGVFTRHLDQCRKARMTFHQGCDVTVLVAAKQITLPMTGDGAVFDFCGPFPDGGWRRRFGRGTVRRHQSAAWTEGAESAPFSALLALG